MDEVFLKAVYRSLGFGCGTDQAQLKQNADGSYVSPWAVNWTDLDGKVHAEPLDINCGCFDPRTTVVLNPDAWENVPDGQWAAQTQQLTFFRNARRPSESFNMARNFRRARNFRMGPEGRYVLQVRVEFQNIFNRKFVPALSGTNLGNFRTPATPTLGSVVNGQPVTAYTAGFGTFGNQANPGTYGTPRSGQFIARFHVLRYKEHFPSILNRWDQKGPPARVAPFLFGRKYS